MAVGATDKMDIMRTLAIEERRVHRGYITLAVGDRRMAILTTGSGSIAVILMARQAADAFVHPSRCSVVACPRLMERVRRMTLNANPLPEIIGDLHRTFSFMELKHGEINGLYVSFVVAVVPQGRRESALAGIEDIMRVVVIWGTGGSPVAMDFVAGETGDCGSR